MADNLLGRVEILLDANTARFESGFARAERTVGESSRNMTRGLQSVTSGAKQTEFQVDSLGRSLSKHEKEVDGVVKGYKLLESSAKMALAGFSVSKVISIADVYGQTAAQIQQATTSQSEYNKVQKHLLETANTTYRALNEAQQVYLDVGGALKAYGASTDRALRITDSLSFSFTHNATAADKAKSATDAFKNSVYNGTVSGDAWRTMLSAIPSIVDDMSESLDISKDKILTMGNAGEFTADQLKDSFDKSREKSEELANNMRNSLADGIQVVSNKFSILVGEANIAYDVTNKMAAALGVLAEHMDTVAVGAAVLGSVYAGRVVNGYVESIAVSNQKRAALKLEQLAEVELWGTKALKEKQSASLAAQELRLAQLSVLNAKNKASEAIAIQKLAVAEIAYNTQVLRSTAAAQAYTVAQNQAAGATTKLMMAKSLLSKAGSSLLGVFGGPVGLAVTLGTVAAGYFLMRDKSDSATKSLKEQGDVVDDVVKKFIALNDETERRNQLRAEQNSLEELTREYEKAKSKLISYTLSLGRSGEVSSDAARIVSELAMKYKAGELTASQFASKLNELSGVSNEAKGKLDNYATSVGQASEKMNDQKQIADALKIKNGELAKSHDDVTRSIKQQGQAQKQLSQEQQSAYDKIKLQLERENYIKKNVELGWARDKAEFMADLRADAKMGFTAAAGKMPADLLQMGEAGYKLQKEADARKKSEQDTAKALKDQEKTTKRLVGLVGSTGRSSGNHLHVQYPKGSNKGGVTAEHLARFQLGGKTIQPSMTNSHYGKMRNGKPHGGWDFAAPAGTEVTTSVAVKDVQKFKFNDGGYTSRVTFADGVVIDLMHQIPSMMSRVGGGASKGSSSNASKDAYQAFQDQQKVAEEAAKKRVQLSLDVEDQVTKIKAKLSEDFEDIEKSGYSESEAAALKAKYQARADNEIAIVQQSLRTKVDSYSEYLKSEEQLLKDSYAERQFEVLHDLDLTKVQREQAASHLQKQMQLELEQLELNREEQLLNAQSSYMRESDYLQARYDLEIKKIQQIKDEKLKAGLLDAAGQAHSRVFYDKRDEVWSNYQNVQANLGGTQQYLDIDNTFSDQQKAVQDARDYELITEQEQKDRLIELERKYQQDKLNLNLSYGEQISGSASDVMGAVFGKQSAAYKVMFAAQKGFAIAQSMIAIQQGIAQAAALPFPTNLPAMAAVAAQTASIISNIQSVGLTLTGQAHDGIDNVPKEGTWLLDRGERVVDRRTNSDLKDYLAAKNVQGGSGGGQTINIFTLPGQTADISTNDDGSLDIRMRQIAEEEFERGVSNPNSRISKAMQQNLNAGRRYG